MNGRRWAPPGRAGRDGGTRRARRRARRRCPSPTSPSAQVGLFTPEDRTGPVSPDISVEVDDVDAVHEALRTRGAEIVHRLTDEEWGVRRFFVRDPNGRVVNVLSHR